MLFLCAVLDFLSLLHHPPHSDSASVCANNVVMGIPGLWACLSPAAQSTTLPAYTLHALTANTNSLRALRLGIDASLWLFHAQQSSGGSNPALRLLFYRLAKLLALPVLVLFVFDGPDRPAWKRGKQVKGRQHAVEQPLTELIEAFGFSWMRAPGEAEAQLASMSREGVLDAVVTDDADALLFGAQVVIRNWGKNLSGTKASKTSEEVDPPPQATQATQAAQAEDGDLQLSGSDRDHLITMYTAHDLVASEEMGLDRDALVLIALMSGGDYDTTGLAQCGVKIALALARAGFGTALVRAFRSAYPTPSSTATTSSAFSAFLGTWLEGVREELRTNARGFLPSRRPKLADALDGFLGTPDSRRVLAYYLYPVTTRREVDWSKSTPDMARLAALAQMQFKWAPDAVLAKFRTTVVPGVVVRRVRREILELNGGAVEGPWAELVESPATKAVKRHLAGKGKDKEKEKPIWDSPNATRITDFFAKSTLTPTSTSTSTSTPGRDREARRDVEASVEIVAIKMVRRHAALAPFRDYRALVAVDSILQEVESALDASASSPREDQEVFKPLLLWIAAPFLELSTSGVQPLQLFNARQKAKSKAKPRPKTTKVQGQTTLNGFVKPMAKPPPPPPARTPRQLKLPPPRAHTPDADSSVEFVAALKTPRKPRSSAITVHDSDSD